MVLSALVAGALVVCLVSAQALVAQSSFRRTDLSNRAGRLAAEYGRLKLEVARLTSPGRLARVAGARGYHLPEEIHVLTVPGRDVSNDRAVPQGANQETLALEELLENRP
jgi:hypothetical protein